MYDIEKLIEITQKLRSEDGCPWDKSLTLKSLRTYIIEESYELIAAIESNDLKNIKEEAGDLLLQIIFISNICEENNDFNFYDVLQNLAEKLIRRHPHVFGDKVAKSEEDAIKIWNEQKQKESNESFFISNTPTKRALKTSSFNAKKGLEFSSIDEILNKMEEEIQEFKVANKKNDFDKIEEELGDILFTCINLCRFNKIDPDVALSRSLNKFNKRSKKFFEIFDGNEDPNKLWSKAKSSVDETKD